MKSYTRGNRVGEHENLSKVKEDQLAIRLQLESERTKISEESAKSRLLASQSQVDQAKATYGLRLSQSQSLRVRAGITGVLQLVPIEKGKRGYRDERGARGRSKKLKAEIKIAETQAKTLPLGRRPPLIRAMAL